MEISFGKKIPVVQAGVYDKNKKEFVKATMYELDGKDNSDIEYLESQNSNWGSLKYYILVSLIEKHSNLSSLFKPQQYKNIISETQKFYTLEAEDGKSIGLCELNKYGTNNEIHLLECNLDKTYKFAGQTILASIAKTLDDSPASTLTVNFPAKAAIDFYTKRCGFEPVACDYTEFRMSNAQMKQFIKNVETATKHELVDLKA